MNISQEFKDAVEEKDIMMVRIMLKDSLIVDPTFEEFNAMISYSEKFLDELYDEHDGEIFSRNPSDWTKDYMDEEMVRVISNFSKERISLLKSICQHLYSNRAKKIEYERVQENSQRISISKKQVGTGLAVAGVVTAVAGVVVSKTLVVGVGVVAAVAGGILIVTDK